MKSLVVGEVVIHVSHNAAEFSGVRIGASELRQV